MTLECSLERFGGVAFLVTGAQPAMAMKSAPFCLTCVVADNVLECFAKGKAVIAMTGTCPLLYGSSVQMKRCTYFYRFFLGSELVHLHL